jgi:outer membrane protein TolC
MFRKHNRILLSLVLIVFSAINTQAQEIKKLTLNDAKKIALESNTNILNSKLDLQIAQKKIWETTAIGLPHFDLSSAYTFLPKVPSIPATMMNPNAQPGDVLELGVKNQVTADLTVSQLIFNGAYFVGLQASKAYFNLAKQNDEKTRLDVVESVENTYYMIQLAEESQRVLTQNLENIKKTLSDVSEMYKQGFLEKTDVDQLEVTANVIKNALSQIESNLDMAYKLLKIQLGLDESAKVELADSLETDLSLSNSSQQLLDIPFGVDRNIDFQLVESAKQMAKLDYKREMTSFMPVITGYYRHSEKLNSPFFDFSPKDVLGLNLSLPIFSSGQRLSVVSQKKMALEKAENNRQLVLNSLKMQASQYQNELKLNLEKLQIQKKNKDLSDEIYQRTLEKYKQGVASSMDLMNTQNQYLTNLTNYFQSIYNLQGSRTKLEKMFNINQPAEE